MELLFRPVFSFLALAIFTVQFWSPFPVTNLGILDRSVKLSDNSKAKAHTPVARQDAAPTTTFSPIASSTAVLNVFQVSLPVLGSIGANSGSPFISNSTDTARNISATTKSGCQLTLMEFSFADSFAKPFVGMSITLVR